MVDVTAAEPATTQPPELEEIRGPSALGGGGRRFFELLWLVAATDFKKSYFGTALGYLWSVLRPLMLFAILLFVFTKIFRLGSQVPHYPELLLFNIVLFSFFQESTLNALSSVVGRESIVRKTQFPRLVIPLATVVTGLLNFAINLVVVLGFLLAFGVYPMTTWLLFPLILGLLLIFTIAVSMLLATLYVRYRDVAVIWGVLVTAIIYGTPVIYPLVDPPVPATYFHILMINPLTPIFVQARTWIIDPSAQGAIGTAGGFVWLLPAIAIYVGVCVYAVWRFNRDAPLVAEQL
jgi:ABC-2 type transport system permease protein